MYCIKMVKILVCRGNKMQTFFEDLNTIFEHKKVNIGKYCCLDPGTVSGVIRKQYPELSGNSRTASVMCAF